MTIRRRIRQSFAPVHPDDGVEAGAQLREENYRNLIVSGAWFGPVDGGIYQYLPVFLARLAAPPSVVSLLTSGPAILGMLAYIPGGAYAERRSDLVRLTLRAGLLSRLTWVLLALLPLFVPVTAIPATAALIWALAAIPAAVFVPAWTAVMQQAVPPERRAWLNGTRWALMSCASGLSLLLFGLFLDRASFPFGYQLVFLLSFIAGVFNLYSFAKVRVPPFAPVLPSATAQQAAGARLAAFFRPFAANRRFARYNIASLAFRLALTMPAGLFSIFWVRELHATNTWIGLRGTVGYAALVVGYWFWGRAANRIGHRRLLFICGAGQMLYPVLTALAPAVPWLLPAALLWGFTMSGIDIGLFDMLLAACPEGRQPSFAAAANVVSSGAAFCGPLLGAGLESAIGIRAALMAIGGLQLAATASFRLLPGREQERSG